MPGSVGRFGVTAPERPTNLTCQSRGMACERENWDGQRSRFGDDRWWCARSLSGRGSQADWRDPASSNTRQSVPDHRRIFSRRGERLRAELTPSDIFRCDVFSQARNSITWIMDLSFGAVLGGGNARSLLDATPLRQFLNAHLDCERIQQNIKRGHLYALAISATNYNSGKSYLFIQGVKGHPMWNRSRRVTLATKITTDHICASAAIPLVFQAVRLKTARGTAFFGDGCMRLQQPLSPV